MSAKEIKDVLSRLLPTITSYPESLIQQALAIYYQSKRKIKLPSHEEAARIWLASWLAAERLSTKLNLPKPKLDKEAPISITHKLFKTLLATFKLQIPEDVTVRTAKNATVTKEDIANGIRRVCKVESTVPVSYLEKTVAMLIQYHPRKESLQPLIAATFLIIGSWKDGERRKITAGQRKKVIEAFGEEITSEELNKWIGIVDEDLMYYKWFEENPVKLAESRKRKAENENENEQVQVKPVKSRSGMGIMMLPEVSFGADWQEGFERWKTNILEKVSVIEEAQRELVA